MRTATSFSLVLLTAFSTQACSTWSKPDDGHVVGQGEVVQRPLTVAEFKGIEVEGSMDVVLVQGNERSVVVEAQSNIADLVTTDVQNGIWHLGTKEGYTTTKDFVVRVSVPTIEAISMEGSGDLKGQGTFHMEDLALSTAGSGNISIEVEAHKVTTAVSGSGDVKLGGTCKQLKVSVAGSGDVNARSLNTDQATVSVAGSGDVAVNVNAELDASIAGSGDVTYQGSPSRVHKDIVGSGEVRSVGGGGSGSKGPL